MPITILLSVLSIQRMEAKMSNKQKRFVVHLGVEVEGWKHRDLEVYAASAAEAEAMAKSCIEEGLVEWYVDEPYDDNDVDDYEVSAFPFDEADPSIEGWPQEMNAKLWEERTNRDWKEEYVKLATPLS